MRLSPEVNCTGCPKMCCHGLARRGHRFADPTDEPKMCKHCDITREAGCRIHTVLSSASQGCNTYTCHWVWPAVVQLYWLVPDQIPSAEIMSEFRERQWIALYIIQLQHFLELHDQHGELLNLRALLNSWTSKILDADSWQISIDIFVRELNILMKEYNIGYMIQRREFCFL